MKIKITPELAEAIGIYVGDGYLRYEGSRKELDISGGYDEKEYYDNHVIPLFNQIFNLSIKGRFFPSRKTYGFVIRDRSVLEIFKQLGFPSGSKSLTVRSPVEIISTTNLEIKKRFIRGVFDTDGSLNFQNQKHGKSYPEFKKKYHYYPRLSITSVSKNLIKDVNKLLIQLKFRYYTTEYKSKNPNWNKQFNVFLVGNNNLHQWIDNIGIKNTTKLTRYLIWKKFGFCPTNITYKQRINILDNKINPYSLYNGPVV